MNLRLASIAVSLLVLLGIMEFSMRESDSLGEMLSMLLLFGFPPIISIILSAKCKHPASLIILAAASLLYGGLFARGVYDTFYYGGPMSKMAFGIGAPIMALTVSIPTWLTVGIIEVIRYSRKIRNSQKKEPS